MDEAQFERAKRILIILKAVDYKWTITEIMEQPELLTDQVFALDVIGNKLLSQARKQKAEEDVKRHGR